MNQFLFALSRFIKIVLAVICFLVIILGGVLFWNPLFILKHVLQIVGGLLILISLFSLIKLMINVIAKE